jgi:hypothetical protein
MSDLCVIPGCSRPIAVGSMMVCVVHRPPEPSKAQLLEFFAYETVGMANPGGGFIEFPLPGAEDADDADEAEAASPEELFGLP